MGGNAILNLTVNCFFFVYIVLEQIHVNFFLFCSHGSDIVERPQKDWHCLWKCASFTGVPGSLHSAVSRVLCNYGTSVGIIYFRHVQENIGGNPEEP